MWNTMLQVIPHHLNVFYPAYLSYQPSFVRPVDPIIIL